MLKIILNLRIYCSWRIFTKAEIGYSNLFAIYEPLFAELYMPPKCFTVNTVRLLSWGVLLLQQYMMAFRNIQCFTKFFKCKGIEPFFLVWEGNLKTYRALNLDVENIPNSYIKTIIGTNMRNSVLLMGKQMEKHGKH